MAYFSAGARLPRWRGNFYYGARYVVYPERSLGDPKISVWLSVDAMASKSHNMPLTPYHFSDNNPLIYIDPDGNDWFVNGETGELMFLRGVSDLANSGREFENIDSWTNYGSDDMFGADVSFHGDRILDNESLLFTAESSEEFMQAQGYVKGFESNVTEREIVTNGSEHGFNDIEITQNSTTINQQALAYFKYNEKGIKRNVSQVNKGRYYDIRSWKTTTYDVYTLEPMSKKSHNTNSALGNIIGSMFFNSFHKPGSPEGLGFQTVMKQIGKIINAAQNSKD